MGHGDRAGRGMAFWTSLRLLAFPGTGSPSLALSASATVGHLDGLLPFPSPFVRLRKQFPARCGGSYV